MNNNPPSTKVGNDGEEFGHPERIVSYFEIKPGMRVADFGSGHGYFTIPLAHQVGPEGKVYALDIQKTALAIVESKARLYHLLNIEPIWSDLEAPRGSKLKDESIDFVLIANILFQTENKKSLLAEAIRILKGGGRLALVEWDETPFAGGPDVSTRVSKETIKSWAEELGLGLDREFEAGSYHYGLLFRKSNSQNKMPI